MLNNASETSIITLALLIKREEQKWIYILSGNLIELIVRSVMTNSDHQTDEQEGQNLRGKEEENNKY